MIYIITGGIDEGKTREIEAIYRQMKKGDGWVSRKVFLNKVFVGYEIQRLSSKEKLPLVYKKEYVPAGWDEIYSMGPFCFSKQAFEFAGKIIDEIIDKNINPVFIDEIGPLELQGKGFCSMLEKILKTQKDIYIVVRRHCIDDVIKRFNFQDYKILTISD
ncbi:MAG: nucleoside-triphosphatase [Candidatus Aminicenantes bacterium]|jgi:nucleoside-triphosphatase THEP1